jgi:hypothetical protein
MKLVQLLRCNRPIERCGNPRLLSGRMYAGSAAQFAVHTGGFSESDAHAFNSLCGRVAPSFLRVGETGASLD